MNTRLSAILRAGLIAYTIVVVLIMVPWTSVPTDDSKLLVLHVGAATFAALLCLGLVTGKLHVPRRTVFAFPIGILLALYVLSGLLSDHPWNSVPAVTRLAALSILYVTAAVAMREVRHVRAWMVAASAAVGLSCLYALSQRLGLPPLPFDLVDQSSALFDDSPGTFGNPNVAGHAIVLAAVFATYLMMQWRWAVVFLALYAVQMTEAVQRGAMVALAAAGVAVALALAIRRVTTRPVPATYATLGAGVLVAVLMVGVAVAVGAALGGWSFAIDNSTILRVNAAASAAVMVADRPLLGYGPGNYVIENPAFWTNYEQHWFVQSNLMNQHVHTDLLEIAIDGGVISALFFVVIIVLGIGYALRLGFEHREAEARAIRQFGFAAAAFFVAFLVDGFFGFNFFVPAASSFLFILLGGMDGVVAGDAQAPARTSRWAGAAVLALGALAVGLAGILPYLGKMASLDGRRAVAARRYAVADIHFAQAERLQPWSWTAPYRRGAAAHLGGQLQDAQTHFARTLKCNPNYIPAMTYLARLKLAEAHAHAASPEEAARYVAEAESLAQRALRLAPLRGDDLDVLGRTYFLSAALETGGNGEAVREHWRRSYDLLTRAIEQGRDADAELLAMIAQSAMKIGDRDAAERAFTDAVALLPSEESPYAMYYAFADNLGSLNTYAAVLASQLVGARRRANTALANRWLSRALEQTAQRADATWNILRAAVDNRPDDPELWAALADAARSEAEHLEYAVLVGDLVARNVALPLTARVMGMVWSEERGALAGATKALVDAQASYGSPGVPREELEEYHALVDRLESTVLSAQRETPGLAVAAINVAHIRGEMGEPERAAAVLEARYGTMTIPERMLAASQYAEALLETGEAEEAERVVRDLIAADPVQAELRVLLARVLGRSGKNQEAWDVYELLLDIPDLDPALRAMLEGEQAALGKDEQ